MTSIVTDPGRIYLLAGLIFHKIVWEVLKSRRGTPSRRSSGGGSCISSLAKVAKLGILGGLAAQTFLPEVWPITAGNSLRTTGLVVYTLGLVIAIMARLQLGAYWSDVEDGYVLEEHRLISRGLYAHIRHPIYTGDLLLLVGFELALNSWLVVAVAGVMMFVLYRVHLEEGILTKNLAGYEAYKGKTKRFVPFVY